MKDDKIINKFFRLPIQEQEKVLKNLPNNILKNAMTLRAVEKIGKIIRGAERRKVGISR